MKFKSLIIISLGLIVYSFIGLIDLSPVTTKQLATDLSKFKDREITLRNIAVLDWKAEKLKDDMLLMLNVTNTHGTFFKPTQKSNSITVLARISDKSSILNDLITYKRWWFPKLRIKVTDKYVVLKTLPVSALDYGSWLTTPYDFSIKILSMFLSLRLSIICALIVQLAITFIVVMLVIEGIVYVLPF